MKASLFFLLFVSLVVCALSFKKTQWFQLGEYTFDDYVREYSKAYSPQELEMRRAIFEEKLLNVQFHNQDPSNTWKKGINHLSDATPEEYRKLLGYDKVTGHAAWSSRKVQPQTNLMRVSDLPSSVDWRMKNVITPVKDQGQCGSCWTFGTAETVESYWALATGQLAILSEQQILDCTPNPNDCGGTGGCGGGTVEIAFQKIIDMAGLSSEWTYPYLSWKGDNFPNCNYSPSMFAALITSWINVAPNQYDPVMNALANTGPLAINVDASSWQDYETGVFGGCNMTSPDIDHVVQLVGYGTDDNLGDYWTIRNSWTPAWGEDGYIRISRSSTVQCGLDTAPQDGTGCNDGPPQVEVCGECGILFDALYPVIYA
jgi:cathepsin L